MKRPKYKKFDEWKAEEKKKCFIWPNRTGKSVLGGGIFIAGNRTGKVRSVAASALQEMGVPSDEINKIIENVFLDPGL